MKTFYFVLAFSAGAMLSFQAAVNTELRRIAGDNPVWAAAASFAIGTLVLWAAVAGQRTWPDMSRFAGAPWHIWLGGVVGAFYVVATVLVAPRLGVAVLFSLVFAGQMTTSILIDNFGWLGFQVRPLSIGRMAGAVLIIAGVFLVRRF